MKKLILVLAMAFAMAFGMCADAKAAVLSKRASTYDANPETDYCDDFIARWDEVVR